MGRQRKKDQALITPRDAATIAKDLSNRFLGRSPSASVLSRVMGEMVFRALGGNQPTKAKRPNITGERRQKRVALKPTQPEVVKLPGGIEYYPPPKKENK